MRAELAKQIKAAVQAAFNTEVTVVLTRPDEQFGDYATNVALKLAGQLQKPPREIADKLADRLHQDLKEYIQDITVAGPGFINLKLIDQALLQAADTQPSKSLQGKTIVAEYSDPNPFKVLHAGHLYTSLVGDAVANLMAAAGAEVKRVNFGGDVGLHVGKTMWAIITELEGEQPEKLSTIGNDKLGWLSQQYVKGNQAYEHDEAAKTEIDQLNKRVYQIHADDDHDSPLAQIYWTCRQWSYDGFEKLYKQLGMVPFTKYYPESDVAELGLQTVKQHIGPVYEQSDGAVIFRGEDHGLFTQVFISSAGLPTYAAKDVGLIYHKQQDFKPDKSFIITDLAQKDHLAVVLKSISLFEPELAATTTNYGHGQIKLAGGVKMSSRLGNILRADDILEAAAEAAQQLSNNETNETILGAVRYAFLRTRIGGDIIYDPKESVSLEGNSGPYLQYAHARARSILAKAEGGAGKIENLEPGERLLVRKLSEYAEVVDLAVAELMPHHVANYLYELAQTFNRFYENNRVIGDPRQAQRLKLVEQYADTLRSGLSLLGIASPDKM